MEKKDNKKVNKIIIAISAIIIFAILAVSVIFIVNFANQAKEQLNSKSNIVQEMAKDKNEEGYEKIKEEVSNEKVIDDDKQVLDRSYGKVEIVWIDKNNNTIAEPLKPVISNMNAIKYNNSISNFELTNENNTDRYDYEHKNKNEGKIMYDYENKMWANAMDENQSFFVWIPRFAYKIVYYSDSTCKNISGYSDDRGILKVAEDGSLIRTCQNNQGLKSAGNHYIVHPAFMNDAVNGFINGGWDDNLDGIWVSKYEISMEVSGMHTDTQNEQIGNVVISDIVKAISKPGVSSWRNISIGNCYYNAFNYNRTKESHLMKGSEWGAVAYLSYSKYGTDSNIITPNNSQEYIAGDSKNPIESFGYKSGESSNGNSTGVYDLSGGAWEYISAFINNGYFRAQMYGGTGQGYLLENNLNTKYKTIYVNSANDKGNMQFNSNDGNVNYLLNFQKRGDAIYETSINGYGNSSWNANASLFPQQDVPFMLRGGDIASGKSCGLFSFNCSTGQANASDGYRIVLAWK